MPGHPNPESGVGLERSCAEQAGDWLRSTDTELGVELFEARLRRSAYHKHRHDTYAICLTTSGVQVFEYRGVTEVSTTGQVVVLHPDEIHDGHAGTDAGFAYRQLYVDPALIFEAVRVLCDPAMSLPFVRAPVLTHRKLAAAIASAFQRPLEPLAIVSLIGRLAEGLIEAESHRGPVPPPRHLDLAAIERARQYLDAEKARVVHSSELEAVTGLTRYDLARQFRVRYGTSPYRYLLRRRLDLARQQLAEHRPIVEVALGSGFADQAHFTRRFKAAFGLTPARYAILRAAGDSAARPRSPL